MKPETKNRIKREIKEWVETIIIAFILAFFIRTYIIQAFKIPSGSMLFTLKQGDHLFVNKFIYGTKIPFTDKKLFVLRQPQRGDIIVFKYPLDLKKDFVKRCIALPGDIVEIKGKEVYINGKKINESYVTHTDSRIFPDDKSISEACRLRDNYGPAAIPPGHYLMLGDNRDNSLDSRFWGFLPERNIKGRAWFIYWPFNRIRIIK